MADSSAAVRFKTVRRYFDQLFWTIWCFDRFGFDHWWFDQVMVYNFADLSFVMELDTVSNPKAEREREREE